MNFIIQVCFEEVVPVKCMWPGWSPHEVDQILITYSNNGNVLISLAIKFVSFFNSKKFWICAFKAILLSSCWEIDNVGLQLKKYQIRNVTTEESHYYVWSWFQTVRNSIMK